MVHGKNEGLSQKGEIVIRLKNDISNNNNADHLT